MRLTAGALLVLVVVALAPAPAAAQEMRVEGLVQSLYGETLTLLSDATGKVMITPSLVPVPAARPTLTVDLSRLPPSEYASMRLGERIGVTGVLSNDGRRVTATAITRSEAPQAVPQAP